MIVEFVLFALLSVALLMLGALIPITWAVFTGRYPVRTAGYVVARVEEIDDTEGPQLVGFSSDVYPTTASASDAHAFAESWRPGWHIYRLADITEEKTR